ncbi:MAG: hypothetical protein H0V00_18830 [Chloroflexia bacterium]|nr:hypothetical protein [Chloroflexia bacterium]
MSESGRRLEMLLDDRDDVRPAISAIVTESGGVILGMQSEEMSLEEAFVTITNQNVTRLAGG